MGCNCVLNLPFQNEKRKSALTFKKCVMASKKKVEVGHSCPASRCRCKYNKRRDIMQVVIVSTTDITRAITDGIVVESNVPARFNQIDSTQDIGQRVRDNFDIIEFQHAIVRYRGARKKNKVVKADE